MKFIAIISESEFGFENECKTQMKVLEVPTNSSIDDFVKNWLFSVSGDDKLSLGIIWKATLLMTDSPIFQLSLMIFD